MKHKGILILFAVSLSLILSCKERSPASTNSKIDSKKVEKIESASEKLNLESIETDFGFIFYDQDSSESKIDRVYNSIAFTDEYLFENNSRKCKNIDLDIFVIDTQNITPEKLASLTQIFKRNFNSHPAYGYYYLESGNDRAKIFLDINLGIPLIGRTSIHEYYHHFQTITCISSENLERSADNFTNQLCGTTRLCENYLQ